METEDKYTKTPNGAVEPARGGPRAHLAVRGEVVVHIGGRKQSGAAALLITMILVVIAGLSALVVNKAAFNEQQLSGTDIRSKEVYNSAHGALDYATGRLQLIYLDNALNVGWDNIDADGHGLKDATATAAAFVNAGGGGTLNDAVAGADTYTPTATYTLLTNEFGNPAVIDVVANAVATNDAQVTKTIRARFLVSNLITNTIGGAPPVVVEKCISNITGTPDIDTPDVAIVTLGGDSSSACIDKGHFDFPGGGDEVEEGPQISLFDMFFPTLNGDRSIIKGWSDTEEALGIPLAQRSVVYVEAGSVNTWNDDLGSGNVVAGEPVPTKPVILFFEAGAGCPQVNGNVTIWGIVFYDQASCDVTVGAQGGGKATIYGTMAFAGDLNKFTANTEIINTDLTNIPPDEDPTQIVSVMPGSIKDW